MATMTIDMTPTFEQATNMCLMIIERSDNVQAREDAKAELLRYARELDRLARTAGVSADPSDTPVEDEG